MKHFIIASAILAITISSLFGQGTGACQKTTDPGTFVPSDEECWKWVNTTTGDHFCFDGSAWNLCDSGGGSADGNDFVTDHTIISGSAGDPTRTMESTVPNQSNPTVVINVEDSDADPTNELQHANEVPSDSTNFKCISGDTVQENLESIDLHLRKIMNSPTVEFLDPDAFSSLDSFVCRNEIDATHDYAIIPKLIPNIYNGEIYSVFRVGDSHNPNANMIIVFRKSVDGGITWTGADGTGSHNEVPNPFAGNGNVPDCSGGAVTPTGRIILFCREFTTGGTYINNSHIWSDDGGQTWSNPVLTATGNQIGYMYDTRFMIGKEGELIYGQRTINVDTSGVRNIIYYASKDDGESWYRYSKALSNADLGYNFGEVVTRDAGNGLWVAIVRLAVANNAGDNFPFIMVSRNYGMTWNGNAETLSFTDIENEENNSGYLQLEGLGVSLGNITTGQDPNKNCLPTVEIIKSDAESLGLNDQQYLLIGYYIRKNNNDEERWKMTALRLDEWMTRGNEGIRTDIWREIYQSPYLGGTNAIDGNGCFFIPKNCEYMIWTTGDNIGTSSAGPQDVYYGRSDATTIRALIADIQTGTQL